MPQLRTPQFESISAGGSFTVPAGWINIAIFPATGATVTLNNGVSSIDITTGIVLGGSGDNSFSDIWGAITISTSGANCDLVINGDI